MKPLSRGDDHSPALRKLEFRARGPRRDRAADGRDGYAQTLHWLFHARQTFRVAGVEDTKFFVFWVGTKPALGLPGAATRLALGGLQMVEIRFRRMAPTDAVRDVTHEKLLGLPGAREGALNCQLVIDHDPAAAQLEPREPFRAHLKVNMGAARKPVEATARGALAASAVKDVFDLIERHMLAEQRRAALATCP